MELIYLFFTTTSKKKKDCVKVVAHFLQKVGRYLVDSLKETIFQIKFSYNFDWNITNDITGRMEQYVVKN